MLRALVVLVCLGGLEAVAVSAPHAPMVNAPLPGPPHVRTDAVLSEKKKASDPAMLTLPLENTVANVRRFSFICLRIVF